MRLILSALLVPLAFTAQARSKSSTPSFSPITRIVKMEPVAASGRCTPGTDADKAHDVMKRFDIDLVNGTASNRLALSRGLLEIERLAGGRFRPAEGATFKILPQRGCAQQLGKVIVLRQGCGSLDSVAYYVHELGHYIGNNDKAKLYGEYKSAIPNRCAVSRYSLKDWTRARARNEEFAEVIAAFVTNPDLLLKSGPNCVKAYNFFRSHVFEDGELAGCGNSKTDVATKKPDAKPSVDLGGLTTTKKPELSKADAKTDSKSDGKPNVTPAQAPVAKATTPTVPNKVEDHKPTEKDAKLVRTSFSQEESEVDFDNSESTSGLDI